MKKLILLLTGTLLLITLQTSRAYTLCWMWESFTYPANDGLMAKTNPNGQTWQPVTGSTQGFTIQAGNLDVEGLVDSEGNSLRLDTASSGAVLIPLDPPVSTGTAYYSLALTLPEPGGLGAGGVSLAGFGSVTGNVSQVPSGLAPQLFLRAAPGGYQLGIGKVANPQQAAWAAPILAPSNTVFVVAGYEFHDGIDNDEVILWIGANPTNIGALSPPVPNVKLTAGPDLDRVASLLLLKPGQAPFPTTLVIDELRAANVWEAVAPSPMDFGDAPYSGTYHTRWIHNGARHRHQGPRFAGAPGAADRDPDPDGMPSLNADGDDTSDGNDDEHGVRFVGSLIVGSTMTVDINTPTGGKVDAFIDWNADHDWADAGEQIFASLLVPPGISSYLVPIPASATAGPTYARFRISSGGGLTYDGPAPNGEVEDYRLDLLPVIVKIPHDLLFPDPWVIGQSGTVQITASEDGLIDLWADLNGNGRWDDAGEQLLTGNPIPAGTCTVTLPIPAWSVAGTCQILSRVTPSESTGTEPDQNESATQTVEIRQPSPSVPLEALQFLSRRGGRNQVQWNHPNAVLQVSSNPNGPWTTLFDAQSPFEIDPNAPRRFFRLVESRGLSRSGANRRTLVGLARDADLIFDGIVRSVSYRNSISNETGSVSLPHTFVTFEILDVLKGRVVEATVCLRFLGGLNEDGETVLHVSHSTRFDVGERSLLFVRRNGWSARPIVGGQEGRFRLVNDQVYSNDGNPLLLTPAQKLTYGPRQHLPEVEGDQIGSQLLGIGHSETQGEGGSFPAPEGQVVGTDAFKTLLREVILRSHEETILQNPILTLSANPDRPFKMVKPRHRPPPAAQILTPPQRMGDPDPQEDALFEANGRDPVLPNQ